MPMEILTGAPHFRPWKTLCMYVLWWPRSSPPVDPGGHGSQSLLKQRLCEITGFCQTRRFDRDGAWRCPHFLSLLGVMELLDSSVTSAA